MELLNASSCISTFDRGSHSRISLNICEHLSEASEDMSAWVYIVQWLVKTCHVSWTARTLSLNNYSSGSIGISGCEDMKYSTHAAKMIRGDSQRNLVLLIKSKLQLSALYPSTSSESFSTSVTATYDASNKGVILKLYNI